MRKVFLVKAENGIFINFDNETSFYHDEFIVNDQPIERSFYSGWYICNGIPEKITSSIKGNLINRRFVLKDYFKKGFFSGIVLPEVIPFEDIVIDEEEDDDGWVWNPEKNSLKSFYTYTYDREDIVVEVPFEIINVLEIDAKLGQTKFSYPKYRTKWKHEGVEQVTNRNIKTSFELQLLYPSIVQEHLPCSLSSREVFDIVRFHVQQNINPQIASISSDYDFCFGVDKHIKLHDPIITKKEIKTSTGRSYKIKKYQEYYVKNRSIRVFETAPKSYQSYPVMQPMIADSYEDLKDKLDKFLAEIMIIINTPLVECSCCNGMGVIEEK